MVGVGVGDDEVEPHWLALFGLRCELTGPLRAPHHDPTLEAELHVLHLAVFALVHGDLLGTEGALQPLDRGGRVLVTDDRIGELVGSLRHPFPFRSWAGSYPDPRGRCPEAIRTREPW